MFPPERKADFYYFCKKCRLRARSGAGIPPPGMAKSALCRAGAAPPGMAKSALCRAGAAPARRGYKRAAEPPPGMAKSALCRAGVSPPAGSGCQRAL